MPPWLVIGVSGVTCGGKTTLAQRLRDYFQQLRGAELWNTAYIVGDVQLISQDDYFLPVDDVRHKWNDKLNVINFELLSSLDMKQMLSDITWTMRGRFISNDPLDNIDFINEMSMSTNSEHYAARPLQPQIYQPNQYNKIKQQTALTSRQHAASQQQNQKQQNHSSHHHYHHHQQQPNLQVHTTSPPNMAHSSSHSNTIMRVNSQHVSQLRDNKINLLIIEGFTIFNQPELLTLCNIKFHFHLPYEKCFERRQKRTYDPPDVTGYFEICVWPNYEKNFNEIRDRQDITFLNGELSKERILTFVLQKIANYFDERCDVACPPPQKLLGLPSCFVSGVGGAGHGSAVGGVLNSELCVGKRDGRLMTASLNVISAKNCPMEHQ
ncbi:uncharacterized protein [Eurosta solidaginis]|uniref:uncharacterized protein n=1 Tax=Eurosta solidaginis TaxID=178769 RepID=UPI0035315894